MKSGSELVKASFKAFFENASEDLEKLVEMLKLGKFMQSRAQMKSVSQSINYVTVALLPILTALFEHIRTHEFGVDLLCEFLSGSLWFLTDGRFLIVLLCFSERRPAVLLQNPDVLLLSGNRKEHLCGEVRGQSLLHNDNKHVSCDVTRRWSCDK